MKHSKKLIFLMLAAPFVLSGCATVYIPLNPGAETVKVIDATASPVFLPPLTCQFKGQVLGSNITPFEPKDLNFNENEIHLIKNNALLLNANLAVIHKNAIIVEGNNYNHASISDAYECYPSTQNAEYR